MTSHRTIYLTLAVFLVSSGFGGAVLAGSQQKPPDLDTTPVEMTPVTPATSSTPKPRASFSSFFNVTTGWVMQKGSRIHNKPFTLTSAAKTVIHNFSIKNQGSLVVDVSYSSPCTVRLDGPGKGPQPVPEINAGQARLLYHTDGSPGSAYSVRLVNDKQTPSITGHVKVYFLQRSGESPSRTVEQRLADLEAANGVLKNQVSTLTSILQQLKNRVNAIEHKDDGKPKACPYFYLLGDDGATFHRAGELIRDLVGSHSQRLETTHLVRPPVHDGRLTVVIREEKDEVTRLDYVSLHVNGRTIAARAIEPAGGLLARRDGRYLVLEKGAEVRLTFDVTTAGDVTHATILAEGYYDPVNR